MSGQKLIIIDFINENHFYINHSKHDSLKVIDHIKELFSYGIRYSLRI